ncbi:similar to Saccharomyces cerevisiae YGL207W SPT16 Subunit of the heterodimeric FACT complex (Spt16p-Pob3p) [Maudiozyma barnettii]|uniref:FACT complex subunit n=1 Tax=Maudiozyma barnettii TaxID=61262 RepID=A0A8H2ZFP3_9SACH|nr:chromatin-remodeling protein SPT16 [Kazachstania barnettii]CAB4251990.1 similar to Saccharomyces cerevisiae YGL207W SPT16 Subunit of the heterodimeric FACT complex (Spt16p-Pob3p) [Kazachstania barnettii]CAD1778399.1 similar to Saccharomyces cerevisiae YGL207W SPT16 Subunit of the heterodimeric FACT complex (Spt16p-Pob3p) [Kazachstania barnettii]
MDELYIDFDKLRERVISVQSNYQKFEGSPNSLLFVSGSRKTDNPYQKTTILQDWLIGYEYPATLIAFLPKRVVVITNASKARHIHKALDHFNEQEDGFKFEILERQNQEPAHNKGLFDNVINSIKEAGTTVGILQKDSFEGKFINEWNPLWDAAVKENNFTFVDVSNGLSTLWESKDKTEQALLSVASKCSDLFMDFLSDEMVRAVDEELKITNAQLSDRIEDKIEDDKFTAKLGSNVGSLCPSGQKYSSEYLEWTYSPIIQSGESFDLKVSARSNNDQLYGNGCILASCGIRYSNYCSNITRTFLIDPSEEMINNYDFMLELQEQIVTRIIKKGKTPAQIYNETVEYIKEKRPELSQHFTKNIGFMIGLEFRDSCFILNTKNEKRTVTGGQCFNISFGFNGLKDSKSGRIYALALADTVQLSNDPTPTAKVLTASTKVRTQISFFFNNEEDDEKAKKKPAVPVNSAAQDRNSKILRTKLRGDGRAGSDDAQKEQIRKENQRKLHEKLQKDGLIRYSEADASVTGKETQPYFKKYESYVHESQIPNNVRDLRIHVDWKTQTIIIPIYGRPVPFHINSYKNGSKNEEGEYTYLRLNFHAPGSAGGISKKVIELPYDDSPENQFVRSITVRSKDGDRISDTFKQIADLKKESTKRDQERKALADVVHQDKLIENKTGRTKRLDQIFVRPSPDTKRVPSTVFIHENGIRYQSPLRTDSRIDILFSNIKNLVFQSCKGELIVIIHVHLKNPIMMGKKKIQDVQFYREASDMSVDETGTGKRGMNKFRRYGDEDELEQEQEERRKRAALDKEFKYFADAIAEASRGLVTVESTFRDLGFQGVPNRSAVYCMPTTDCLVQLVEPPFMVVNLEEIEICILERVQFGLKNFDMVFAYKDITKPVTHINTIPIESLDFVKQWLTDMDIPYTVSTINLNWGTIMKSIQDDPHQFFLDGGWTFLATGSDDEASDESEEEISEYEASEEEPEDESDYSEDNSDEASMSDEGSEEYSGDDSEEEGDDWDDLEKKAANADRGGNFKD